MSHNSRLSSAIRSQRRPIGRMNGNRPSRKERGFCTHGVPKAQCKKKHSGDDGSAMAGGAMA